MCRSGFSRLIEHVLYQFLKKMPRLITYFFSVLGIFPLVLVQNKLTVPRDARLSVILGLQAILLCLSWVSTIFDTSSAESVSNIRNLTFRIAEYLEIPTYTVSITLSYVWLQMARRSHLRIFLHLLKEDKQFVESFFHQLNLSTCFLVIYFVISGVLMHIMWYFSRDLSEFRYLNPLFHLDTIWYFSFTIFELTTLKLIRRCFEQVFCEISQHGDFRRQIEHHGRLSEVLRIFSRVSGVTKCVRRMSIVVLVLVASYNVFGVLTDTRAVMNVQTVLLLITDIMWIFFHSLFFLDVIECNNTVVEVGK